MLTDSQLWSVAGVIAALAALILFVAWRKGRPFTAGDVFRASRWTRGNHWLPTQVLVTPSNVVQYKPRWIGRQEESIHMAHIASVRIDTRLLFSDVYIETSGGASPITCHGHTKRDAARIKELIGTHQYEYYRGGGSPAGVSTARVRVDN